MTVHPITRDQVSAPFFDAAARGVLLIRQCPAHQRYFAPSVSTCDCGAELHWVPASGRGELVSWAAVPGRGGDASKPECILAIVQLDEGPWLRTSIIGAQIGQMAARARLEVVFRHAEGADFVPLFAPAGSGVPVLDGGAAVLDDGVPLPDAPDRCLRPSAGVQADPDGDSSHDTVLRPSHRTPVGP